jgi:hypothetical protein
MQSVMVNMLSVGVQYNPADNTFTFSGPDIVNREITVEQGISMIGFSLTTAQGSEFDALFQSDPIQWFEEDGVTPMVQPSTYLVQWFRPKYCTITCFNADEFMNIHNFNIVIAYNGQTFGTDPVIVNQPPMPVGGEGPNPDPHSRRRRKSRS